VTFSAFDGLAKTELLGLLNLLALQVII